MPSVVATFPTLAEAKIVCSALRSAGFEAEVLDAHFGSVLSADLVGGFRITVPDEEAEEAEAFLEEVGREG